MSEISIIVPVYNAVAYLRKSLDSIVNQSYRDIEFIFVDDGSCDDSLAILKEYEAADKRVTVLHQENRGAGAARNYGMSVAGGKYLLFLDCDDIFETSMVEKGEFSLQVQDPRRSYGVLRQSIPVPFSTREPSSAGCLFGTLPSNTSHAG